MRAQQVTPSSPFCGGEGERIVPGGVITLRVLPCTAQAGTGAFRSR